MRLIAAALLLVSACQGKESVPVAGSAPATAAEVAVITDAAAPVDRYRTLVVPEVAAADRPPPPTDAPIALIAALQVSFEGAPVVRVIGGKIDPAARDDRGTITALSELYGAYARATTPAPAQVHIAIVPQMQAALALDVMESLASAGQLDFGILVRTPEGSGALPVRLGTQPGRFAVILTDEEVRAGSKTIPLKAPDVWKQLRQVAREAGQREVSLQVQGEVLVRDLVPAIIAVRQDDDGGPLATDVTILRWTPPPPRNDAVAMQEDAVFYAQILSMTAEDDSSSLSAQMERTRPGADLGTQIDAVRNSGSNISVGGGSRMGDHVATGTGPRIGGPGDLPGTSADPAPATPSGRIMVTDKKTFDDSSLTPEEVLRKVQSVYMSGLKRCYKRTLRVDPTQRGELQLGFTVNESGRTVAANARYDDDELEACVESQLRGWTFSKPKDVDGDATEASFQLTFQLSPE